MSLNTSTSPIQTRTTVANIDELEHGVQNETSQSQIKTLILNTDEGSNTVQV